jgi:hypothetical protein
MILGLSVFIIHILAFKKTEELNEEEAQIKKIN